MHRFSRLARLVAVPVLAAGMIASLSVQAGADPAHPDKVKPKKSYVLTAQMTGAQETPPVDTDVIMQFSSAIFMYSRGGAPSL